MGYLVYEECLCRIGICEQCLAQGAKCTGLAITIGISGILQRCGDPYLSVIDSHAQNRSQLCRKETVEYKGTSGIALCVELTLGQGNGFFLAVSIRVSHS